MTYFSLFSGIGGFEKGIENVGIDWECIGYSEIDKYAKAIYSYHYPEYKNYGNAKDIIPEQLPDFELLVGGFPCQSFSIAGKRGGFDDTRGTLFFDVARILKAKRPEWFLLENVKGLCSHGGGETLATIYKVLTDIGYTVGWEVVNSCKFGVPQNRERAFFVGYFGKATKCIRDILPIESKNNGAKQKSKKINVIGNIFPSLHEAGNIYEPNGISATVKSNGPRASFNKAIKIRTSGTDIRVLTPIEYERLQGFPDDWTKYGLIANEKVEISDNQRYKSLGNVVTVSVIEAFASNINKQMQKCS